MPQARFDAYRTVAFSGISAAFTPVGTPLAHPTRIFMLLNNTNADMIFSVDQVNNNFYLPAGSFQLFDITGNTDDTINSNLYVAVNTQFYVMQASGAATSGAVFLECIYAQQPQA